MRVEINDLELGLRSKISKFADDRKLGGRAMNKTEIIQKRNLFWFFQWHKYV